MYAVLSVGFDRSPSTYVAIQISKNSQSTATMPKKMRRKKASVNLITRNVFEQDANCEYDQLKFQLYQSIKWEHDVFGLQLPTKGTYKEKITACQNHSTRFIFTKTCIGCQDVELKKQEELESLKA